MAYHTDLPLDSQKKIRGERVVVKIRERVLYDNSRVYCLIKGWNNG